MRQPGFEPGSTAWKATILTTRLMAYINDLQYVPTKEGIGR